MQGRPTKRTQRKGTQRKGHRKKAPSENAPNENAVPFDWDPFRSVRFHRHSKASADVFKMADSSG